ncbi:MAG: 16S rRNA (cytosine(1402)-N(4))-methyltransferase RsmH [Bacteroidales bacterium]|nr:16S rRNA (cytosine(1402)-N(4))-methyltransferase RsmH [Bacteroidales bacterium]
MQQNHSVERTYHQPVMVEECLDGLNIRRDGIYVDATFGGGGHSRAILEQLGSEGRLYAFDRDADARCNAIDDARFCLIGENFRHLKRFLRLYGVHRIDGLLADLGVSSHQLDEGARGFSTRMDGPLDLRMDRREGTTAADLVNAAEESELERILRLYGELPNSRQMARAIVERRAESGKREAGSEVLGAESGERTGIWTTGDLKEAVEHLLPRGRENKTLAMLFQALRIEVNGELDALREMLEQAVEIMNPGGRLCVMSYHSLEDRLVKNFFRAGNFEGKVEKDFYGVPQVSLKVVTRHPITAGEEELMRNNRARSAKLRVAEKVEIGN